MFTRPITYDLDRSIANARQSLAFWQARGNQTQIDIVTRVLADLLAERRDYRG